MFGRAAKMQEKHHILDENEIVDGIDELGVLLYGHDNNAYWYGSQLSIEETRKLALSERHRPAGDLRRARRHGVGAGKSEGRHRRSRRDGFRPLLEIQMPYLGPVKGYYTDWTPLTDRPGLFPEDIDTSDPWQFKNVLVR
jgi:homospermidine synthase